MPIDIKAYACKYRCRKIGVQWGRIKAHEEICFHNPARRACKTCEMDDGLHGGYDGEACERHKDLTITEKALLKKQGALADCSQWKLEGA